MATRLTQSQIEERIPHRPPFLWVDEVVELTDNRIVARKFVDPACEVFKGHYPGKPILPGALQCEAAMQAGAVLISETIEIAEGKVPVATRLNNVKFRRLVKPGETIDIEVELTERLQDAFFMKGKVSVDGRVSTRLEFACTAADDQ